MNYLGIELIAHYRGVGMDTLGIGAIFCEYFLAQYIRRVIRFTCIH